MIGPHSTQHPLASHYHVLTWFSIYITALLWLPLYAEYVVAQDAAPATAERQTLNRDELELRVMRQLIQMETGDRQQRDEAEVALTELGTDVLPLLPAVNESMPAETEERLTRIRRTLQNTAASDTLESSRVTLEGSFSVKEAFAKFTEQTGNQITLLRNQPGLENRNVSIEFQDMDFWPALDQLLDQAGMTTNVFTGQQRTLGVVPKPDSAPPRANDQVAYVGQFRVEATEIQANRNLRTPNSNSMRMRIEVMWEPRTLPILVRQAYSDVSLIDDNGASIDVAAVQGASEVAVQSTVGGIDIILPITLPPRSVKQIASVKGLMTAMMPGRVETFEFDQLKNARNVEQKKGGVSVTLERVRKNGAVHEFRLRLTLLDDSDSFQSHLDWASGNQIYLVDKQNQRIDNPNYERYLERDRSIGFAYLFPVSGDINDYRLVYRTPAAIITVPIDYELKNLPLP